MQGQRHRRPNRQPRRGNRGNDSNHSNAPNPNQNSTSNLNRPSNPGFSSSRPPRPRPEYTPVPAYNSILTGSGVSIILKQDQPTGTQVTGIVAELLTRGDHPRGVKVRLRDGRVGRVQALVSDTEGQRGEELVGGADVDLCRNGETSTRSFENRGGGRGSRRGGFRHVRDIREDDEYLYNEERGGETRNMGYFAALEAADAEHAESKGWGRDAGERPEVTSEMAVCPVCGLFEGDERAVAHHVEGHFQENG